MRYLCILFVLLFANAHAGKKLSPGESAISRDKNTQETQSNISIVNLGGTSITLKDNTKWDVAPNDTTTASGWIVGADPVIVKKSTGKMYPYTMYNLHTKEKIRVKKASP